MEVVNPTLSRIEECQHVAYYFSCFLVIFSSTVANYWNSKFCNVYLLTILQKFHNVLQSTEQSAEQKERDNKLASFNAKLSSCHKQTVLD